MIDVADRANVHVRFSALKFLFRHCLFCSSLEIFRLLNFWDHGPD
jgi:hypothetical protein